ncbi:hypothetical protein ACJMK2_019120 [Sinanodonta woodiana]|uniref:BTB domain-containing protein n=1 Tax=Sinanodonta woodiana TaxID=1069815 RepID=A0ABD3UHI4_SINWO
MSEAQGVQADGYGDSVIKKLNALRQKNELTDFKVSAEGRVFEVHKALLAATSDYFRVMFGGVMAESKQDTVDLKGVTADGLQHIIDFIYSGEMALHLDNLTEIINTASHLQVSSALDLCSMYIKSLMTFDNSEDFLSIADTYSLDNVLDHWDRMIQNSFHDFCQTQTFLKMDSSILVKHLSQNSLRVASEYKLFQYLEKWFRFNPLRINADGPNILRHVRFSLMSQLELASVQDSEIIKRCPGAIQYVASGFKYHMDCKDGHPTIDTTSTVRRSSPCLVLVHHGSSYMPFQITSYDNNSGMFYRLFSDVNGSRDCRTATVDNFAYICRIVDFGGGTLMSSLFRFDPRHLVCHELRPMRRLRLDFAMLSFGHYLYVFGGSTEQFAILDSVEVYNTRTNMWEEAPPLPLSTHSLAAVTHSDKIYLTGGVMVTGNERQAMNTFLCYHPSTRRYETKPGMFYARRLHDMITFEGKIYVFGGIPRQGTPLHGQIPIECFSLSTSQWTMLSSTLSGRSVRHYIDFDNQILSLGHEYHGATEDEIWVYNPELDTWTKYAKAPQRLSLTSAICMKLYVNFDDDKISKLFLKDK